MCIARRDIHRLPVTDDCAEPKKTRRSLNSFNFKVHCLFCGEYCNVEPDKKNPSRWRPAYLVRTVDPKNPYKKVILNVCAQRGDAQADAVFVRVNGAIADLHSAEARYHDDCRKLFMNEHNVQSVVRANLTESDEADEAFEKTCQATSQSEKKDFGSPVTSL